MPMGSSIKMKWSSFLSQASSLENAVQEACQAVTASLYGVSSATGGSKHVDFAAVFISESWRSRYRDLLTLLRPHLSAKVLIGCSGGGVIGGAREVEHNPAVSINAAFLPGVTMTPFHLQDKALPDLDAAPEAWCNLVGITRNEQPHFILLADPFTFRTETLVAGLDYAFPRSSKIGGLVSGGRTPGENALYLNDKFFSSGLVGIGFTGNLALDTVVAQGCRPIGKPMIVTACDRHFLLEVDHQPPIQAIQNFLETLNQRDRELASHSLFLGILMDPLKQFPQEGDFLIRNLVGADTEQGILVVGSNLRLGQTVQFHVRDSEASKENLESMLTQYRTITKEDAPQGALLFSCLGRGEFLYGVPHHDSQLFTSTLGKVPLGGFFCNGEIGPVGETTYLHGYTSCFGLFREAKSPADSNKSA